MQNIFDQSLGRYKAFAVSLLNLTLGRGQIFNLTTAQDYLPVFTFQTPIIRVIQYFIVKLTPCVFKIGLKGQNY